jgi:hypothetical protein
VGPRKTFSFFRWSKRAPSCTIRANQIGEYLGAKIDPKAGYENDICIYVKFFPPLNHPPKTYIDLNDSFPLVSGLKQYSSAGIITLSKAAQNFMSQRLGRDILCIPQHHCNYLREQRNRDEIKTVGVIGSEGACDIDHNFLTAVFKSMGLNFLSFQHPTRRQQVIDFYKSIDIQVIYRPKTTTVARGKMLSSLKLANASSFGIPTVAFPEEVFVDEFNGCFIPVHNPEELIRGVKELTDVSAYNDLAEKARERAEKYHIENIAELYQQL